ncbi:hypothetical protein Amir_2975 [Actinosynnema mirum DSM 43827]|uniref:Uncharacterized protein n=1 Tax=Actinosynnema mirum (strain ATCC 29888 / DSM 43827 / JCM 3225 / NBRC 14064 / NCIMB 13271 / NRRL B-12336 / IMRU 3971 / 101) TaxID=446462 RepID=C6WRQ3_ACTMD|nr:hypothetical protein Amir_2975 [Actinosynnema mirum DSM 43827]
MTLDEQERGPTWEADDEGNAEGHDQRPVESTSDDRLARKANSRARLTLPLLAALAALLLPAGVMLTTQLLTGNTVVRVTCEPEDGAAVWASLPKGPGGVRARAVRTCDGVFTSDPTPTVCVDGDRAVVRSWRSAPCEALGLPPAP